MMGLVTEIQICHFHIFLLVAMLNQLENSLVEWKEAGWHYMETETTKHCWKFWPY